MAKEKKSQKRQPAKQPSMPSDLDMLLAHIEKLHQEGRITVEELRQAVNELAARERVVGQASPVNQIPRNPFPVPESPPTGFPKRHN